MIIGFSARAKVIMIMVVERFVILRSEEALHSGADDPNEDHQGSSQMLRVQNITGARIMSSADNQSWVFGHEFR